MTGTTAPAVVRPEALPFPVAETEHFWIPLPDGRRLAARRWVAQAAGPVPAILEYLPYRKRDGTAERDALTHPYLAGHGYACVRVDVAGTGDSEGLFDDEYSEQEMRDGEAVIAWIAAQGWCGGAVGMIGISWGGFNGLQLAARRPPALKAVVSICSSADRYGDDIHYKGGCLLGENPAWASTVLSWFSLPPDPAIVGERWREMWLERLEATPFAAETWSRHGLRDAYWRRGSVCEDYAAIEAPVLAVGGWHDGYRNTIARLVENLSAPVKGIVGPWNHKYPHFARPGPAIGFLQEVLRWFDRWLKDAPNGAEDDPAYRAWLMDGIAPATDYEQRPGRWIAERVWPSPRIAPQVWRLCDAGLTQGDAPPFRREARTYTACGLQAGEFFPFGFGPAELPGDQRPDDALSTCFDGPQTDGPTDIVGAPQVRLTLSSDAPRAQIAVRLCDVAPNGASALISYAVLDLRHRDGHARAEDLTPGRPFDVSLRLDQTAYRLPAGRRLRVAISPIYWPFMWPEGEAATLTLTAGTLSVPVRPTADGDEWRFPEPEGTPPRRTLALAEPRDDKRVEADVTSGETHLIVESFPGETYDVATGLVSGLSHREIWTMVHGDPGSARVDIEWRRSMARGDWRVRSDATLSQRLEDDGFRIEARLVCREGDAKVFERTFSALVKRS
ncbi:MAG: CocE/NonD family hydrolase [Pseudomonadota bacterium]